ncbi:MAG TPA: RDD family protein [Solirubrobacteraceae bacterium]|nr:RDD family protein [Solirubrobacteraceae bacterium]
MAEDRRDLTPGDPLGGDPLSGLGSSESRPGGAGYAPGSAPPGAFAPRPEAPLPPAISPETLAGWGARAIATIIDGIIIGAIAALLLAAFGLGFANTDSDGGLGALIVASLLAALAFAVVSLVYAPALMARTNGQTLGKKAAGTRVVRTSGQPTDFWWSALREVVIKGLVVGFASSVTGGLAYLADVLWPLPDGQNRALHDFVVDSRVVRA